MARPLASLLGSLSHILKPNTLQERLLSAPSSQLSSPVRSLLEVKL